VGMDKDMVVFQASDGSIELRVDGAEHTIWATRTEMAAVFNVTPQNISQHIRNIYAEAELSEEATRKESLLVQKEAGREVKRKVDVYNLDVIIAVGYRIGSKQGTAFRIWATKTLKQYIVDGYVVDKARIQKNYDKFMQAVDDIKKLGGGIEQFSSIDALDLVGLFASTWFSLDAYDKSELPTNGVSRRQVEVTADELMDAIGELKQELISKGEATELFATEREKSGIESIVGNVFQSFGGQDVYGSVEEKAAHLLYFVVKNHVFIDGNKRSGAFAFVWYLRRSGLLDMTKISPEALTALTLLTAESAPSSKDQIIGLIMLLLGAK
jgi:prophage maintenance system killer protein